MRLLADENVSNLVVDALRQDGHDIVRVGGAAASAPDEAVLAMARTEDRVLLTEDRDFGQLVIQQQLPVLGVVLIELDVLSNDAEAARVLSVFQSTGIDMAGNLVVIEPSRTRVRPLPGRERD